MPTVILQRNDSSGAAYAFVQSAGNAGSATPLTVTLASAPASGDLVVVVCGVQSGTTINTPTSTGATWTQAVAPFATQAEMAIYYSTTCTTAAITANFSGNNACEMIVLHATGAAVSPLDQTNGAYVVSATPAPGSITPTQDGEFIVAALWIQSGTISGAPSGYTAQAAQLDAGNHTLRTAYLIQPTAAATNPTWAATGGVNEGVAVASFKHA